MKEYKLSKGWAVFLYIISVSMIVLFTWLLIMPFTQGADRNLNSLWVLAPLSLGMIAFMVFAFLSISRDKFIIDQDKIISTGVFSTRQMLFNEISGFRLSDKYIFIEPIDPAKKKIKISTYFGKLSEIKAWLYEHYPDLDQQQVILEQEEILNNDEFGWTAEQRQAKFKLAQNISRIMNVTGGIISAWTVFIAEPYEYAILASIVVPILAVGVLRYFGGLIRVDGNTKSAYPTIFWAIFACSMGLGLRGLLDFHVFDYSNLWVPVSVISIAFTGLIIVGNREFGFKKSKDFVTLFSVLIFVCFYGFGSVITLNCFYDTSEPAIYVTPVLDKRISSGKSTTYYLQLGPWGERTEAEEVSVQEDLYHSVDVNDEVNVALLKGKFDIPWFVVIN